jgi:hypothetical protein
LVKMMSARAMEGTVSASVARLLVASNRTRRRVMNSSSRGGYLVSALRRRSTRWPRSRSPRKRCRTKVSARP